MSYSGNTYNMGLNRGGFAENDNWDVAQPLSMISPTKNINLHKNGRMSRGGTSHIDAAVMSGTPQILGLFDYRLKDGNQHIIRCTGDGKIYRDALSTIKTSMDLTSFYSFAVFSDELFIANGINIPQSWDGSAATTSDITGIPGDWSNGNNPQVLISHGYRNSNRMWAMACAGTPYNIYVSPDGDAKDFSDANVITLFIDTGDGFGIIGGFEFGDRLFAVGKRKTYLIQDFDTNTDNWGYEEAQWKGGAASFRLIVETPNDIVCMMEDGEIYSVIAAETYGDYKSGSITRQSFMFEWIKDNLDLSRIDQFHVMYDMSLRAIKFFVVRKGQKQVDTSLIYFIDRRPIEAWMIHSNEDYASGYSASCSAVVREDAGAFKIYTGDYSGFVWGLETNTKNDNNNAYYSGFKTPRLDFGNPRTEKNFKRGFISFLPTLVEADLKIKWWIDDEYMGEETVEMQGTPTGEVLGVFVLGTDALGMDEDIIDSAFEFGNVGKRLQLEVYNSDSNEPFYITKILIDFKKLGSSPA